MASEAPQQPLLAASRPALNDSDTGPFASQTIDFRRSGPGPRELELDPQDRDIIVSVRVADDTARLLHLANVRADTADEARRAANGFLDTIEVLPRYYPSTGSDGDDGEKEGEEVKVPRRNAHTMIEDFDDVHLGVRDYLVAGARRRRLRLRWDHGGFPRDMFRRTFNHPRYGVSWREDGALLTKTGTRK